MKVKMTQRREGQWFEDDEWRSYPEPGKVLDTNPTHAADLCAQGYAKPVAEERQAETRPAPVTEEKRATTSKPAPKPGPHGAQNRT